MVRSLSEQNALILKDHAPTPAVLELLKAVYAALEGVNDQLKARNYGSAQDDLLNAMDMLPYHDKGAPHDQPWPTKRHFCVSDFGFNPAYKPIYDIELGR